MTALNMITVVIIMLLIFAIGSYLCHEHRRRRESELDAARERQEIRHLAEDAMSSAASCAAVIDKIAAKPQVSPPRRRLQAIRNERTGEAAWRWD